MGRWVQYGGRGGRGVRWGGGYSMGAGGVVQRLQLTVRDR